MKHILKLIILWAILRGGELSAQQYPLFTNYVVNTYGFNPGVIGMTEKFDVRATYRTQWVGLRGQPQTSIVMLNGKVKNLGIGGYFFQDKAGQLSTIGGNAMLSYTQKLDERNSLALGISAGYRRFTILDNSFLKDPNDPIVDNGNATGLNIPDMNLGLYFQQKDGLFLGFSVPQLFQKKLIFEKALQFENTAALVRQYYGIAGYTLKMNDKFSIEPSALIKVTPKVAPQMDVSVRGIFNKMFWVGGSYRSQDAVTAMAGIDQQKWYLAYSYDVTTSQLRNGSSGSHEVSLGMRFGGKCPDEDKDGICDKDDKCPKEPGPKENKGCPEEKKEKCPDKDKDGVCDKDDKCPDVPGPKDNQGCPTNDRDGDGVRDDVDKCPDIPGSSRNEGCPMSDRDKDGILDEVDPCPDQAGPLTNMGCPPEGDRDKDGTIDKDDQCPDVPGPKENKGCPIGDRDGDGVPDNIDRCPNTAGPASNQGCPIPSQPDLDALTIAIRNLYFDTDKWTIRPSSFRDLNNVARIMKERKDWKLRITGHADPRGNNEHNIMLSKNRATAVRNYLISKGVSPNLLIVEYFGESQSQSKISDPAALQLDRRVDLEFHFD
jgi:type IX secretion system PorP/SprF family membrane protein